jgi:anti-sigma-K factor RskA
MEERSRMLFQDSVDGLDMALRSRLTQARHAALEAASRSRRSSWFSRASMWRPAVGVSAAAVLGVALWFGAPLDRFGGHFGAGQPAVVTASVENQSTLEDLELVASSEENSGDALDMLQEDIDFYDWADKTASADPAV